MKKIFFAIVSIAIMTSCEKQETVKDAFESKQLATSQVVNQSPVYLYKVLSVEDWAKTCDVVHLSAMDEAFIHLSTEAQLDKIIEKYWAEAPEYVVLKLEAAKLLGKLVFEANPGGTNQYYHLYDGAIPVVAIIEMKLHTKGSFTDN